MNEDQVTLSDGRVLAYAEYGDRSGRPVFYFHGFPGSRLEASLASSAAREVGARLIALDRPGYGRSAFKPGRRILDWAEDVDALADALQLGRFAALGVSGGGPYLCACALKLARRLTHAGIFCGLGPLDRAGATRGMLPLNRVALRLAAVMPATAAPLARLVSSVMMRWPDLAMSHFASRLPDVDARFLRETPARRVFIDSYRESMRSGPRGAAWDLRLYTQPWEFRQEDVAIPVHFWHGERDTVVPPALARAQHEALRDCRARMFSDDAHFSVVFNHTRAMLEQLTRDRV
jgi:pimeloyl-ACP methyl ester carboxylesterase